MEGANQTRCCEECGSQLRPWDFLNGRAVMSGDRAFCQPCKPATPPTTPPIPETKGETRWRHRRNRQIL